MKVKVSKVMAKAIAKAMKERGYEVEVTVVTMSESSYTWNVGTNAMLDAKDNCDYDWYEGMFKVIQVCYGPDDYACPNYVTTAMLDRLFKNKRLCPNGTTQELMDAVCHEIEI